MLNTISVTTPPKTATPRSSVSTAAIPRGIHLDNSLTSGPSAAARISEISTGITTSFTWIVA